MTVELSPWVPAALGFAVSVFVWAVLCAAARRKRSEKPRKGCKTCLVCGAVKLDGCVGFPKHGHAWCGCAGGRP